jgi:hypothetical protein
METREPIIHLSIAGGSSPATGISFFLNEDNSAIAAIRNAWPIGKIFNEAGIYKTTLAETEIALLKNQTERFFKLNEWYGEKKPGSLKYSITMRHEGRSHNVNWNDFADIPIVLKSLKDELLKQLDEVRKFPFQTVQINLKLHTNDLISNAVIHLTNTGKEAIRINIPKEPFFRERSLLLTNVDKNENAILNFPVLYSSGVPFPFNVVSEELIIAPDATIKFEDNILNSENKYWHGIAELKLNLEELRFNNFYCNIISERIEPYQKELNHK